VRAIVYHRYGSPDVLEFREVEQPTPAADEALVRVQAASVNPYEWHAMTGTPYLLRMQGGLRTPKSERLGTDFAGTVEAVGENVKRFQPGDDVFGIKSGAYAEYVCVREEGAVAPKPANLSFEEAAAVPIAATTALQGLRDEGGIRSGRRVLINGASGGVGTFAVQLAKSFGTEVTGVCSTDKVERARSLGADHVIDYTREDFTRADRGYDLLLDIAGNRSWSDLRRVLEPEATLVFVGGPKRNRLIGPFGHIVTVRLAALRSGRKVTTFLADVNQADLAVLSELLEAGTVTPVIDRRYELGEAADAFRYLEEGHTRGKIILTI
jgi:NADPH:quinone reductase-like Zn-dependent oxidoreductase